VSGRFASPGCEGTRSSRQQVPFLLRKTFLLLAALLLSLSGCKKKEPEYLSQKSIHAISRELVAAARAAAPPGTQVRLLPPLGDKDPHALDRVEITLPQGEAASSARPDVAKLQQALGAVATHRGLTAEPSESHEGILVYYLKNGARTHTVHIHGGAGMQAAQRDAAVQGNGPKLAIILDDLGSDRAAAEEIFKLSFPVTISILPNHEHSAEIAHEALQRGLEVMLHLPMEAIASERPEAQELRPGMPANEVSRLLDTFLESVPGAVGVNNHQGSRATSDSALMRELMPALRDRHLFYIDSRTTAATVAYDEAQSAGEPSAFRNVPFLDDVPEVAAVRKQLELALRGAQARGQAVAIGHPHPATLQALRELQSKSQEHEINLVFVSELVH
jgi:polysaccharide deacetylase 2 family uncharacterized protein YibQ